jgi:hypothetical protein
MRLLLDTEYREISREPASYMPALKPATKNAAICWRISAVSTE